MFKFLQSLFTSDVTASCHPDFLVIAAIERAVDGTDPWIRAVSGYQKKLRPAVLRSIDHVIKLVDELAVPVQVEQGIYDCNPLLHTFFISNADMWETFASDRTLAEFEGAQGDPSPRVTALLTMVKQEKTVVGAALSGAIVLHDVPQISVSFEDHRLFDPAVNEDETRHQLKRRAYDHLLSLALSRISQVKTGYEKLDHYQALVQSKLNLLQRGGWGFGETAAGEELDKASLEKLLARIESQLLELGGDNNMLEVYLDIVIDVLSRPEEHLWVESESLIVDRMGIKRVEAAGDAPKVMLEVISDSEGRSRVVLLVDLP